MKTLLLSTILFLSGFSAASTELNKEYTLWYNRPAYNRGGDFSKIVSRGYPYDEDWERWSLPIGNGAMGACIFGRTDVERIQLAEKTMGNKGAYGMGGFTNFAEIYLDIHHNYAQDYKRTLRLNDAISTVSYKYEGTEYSREYFASNPANVIAVKLKASQPGMISFTVRPVLPYLHAFYNEQTGRTGHVQAEKKLITLKGEIQYFHLPYEGQIKVINYGGTLSSVNKEDNNGIINVSKADSVILYITAATSYELKDSVFLLPNAIKFKGNAHPHNQVTERIRKAVEKGYEYLRS